MREMNGIVYYTSGDVSAYVGKNCQTVVAWDKLSDFWEHEHGQRFVPKPARVNGQRLYTKEQVREIKRFAERKNGGGLFTRAKKEYEAKKEIKSSREKKQSWATDRRNKRDL